MFQTLVMANCSYRITGRGANCPVFAEQVKSALGQPGSSYQTRLPSQQEGAET